MLDWLIGCAVTAGLVHVGRLLVDGFRADAMVRYDGGEVADRRDQPILFWFNAVLNAGWLGGLAALLLHMIREGGL